MVNSEKLRSRAKELGIRQADIAAALNLRQSTVSQKIRNVRPMLLSEAEKLAELLQIDSEEFGTYFFSQSGGRYISREEWSLIEKYRQLPRSQQLLMHALMMPQQMTGK